MTYEEAYEKFEDRCKKCRNLVINPDTTMREIQIFNRHCRRECETHMAIKALKRACGKK